jgi:hypothetical protein
MQSIYHELYNSRASISHPVGGIDSVMHLVVYQNAFQFCKIIAGL